MTANGIQAEGAMHRKQTSTKSVSNEVGRLVVSRTERRSESESAAAASTRVSERGRQRTER